VEMKMEEKSKKEKFNRVIVKILRLDLRKIRIFYRELFLFFLGENLKEF